MELLFINKGGNAKMYNLIRIIMTIIIYLIIIVILKKTRKWSNNTQIIAIVFAVAFNVVISRIKIENMFITFSSPEKVLNYYIQGEYVDAVEGKNSCMVLYTTRTSGGLMFIHKENNGYKLPTLTLATYPLVNVSAINSGGRVETYKVNGTNEYYIYVVGYNDIEKVLLDNGRELVLHKESTGSKLHFYTYAYIEDYNSQSYIMIDNQKVDI